MMIRPANLKAMPFEKRMQYLLDWYDWKLQHPICRTVSDKPVVACCESERYPRYCCLAFLERPMSLTKESVRKLLGVGTKARYLLEFADDPDRNLLCVAFLCEPNVTDYGVLTGETEGRWAVVHNNSLAADWVWDAVSAYTHNCLLPWERDILTRRLLPVEFEVISREEL